MRDFTCWAQLSARPVRPLEQPEEQRRKNASSEKSVGNWYISNSGREVSPRRRRRRCRMVEPCLLVASLPSNQPVSPSAAGSVVPGEFLRSEYVDGVAPYPGRIWNFCYVNISLLEPTDLVCSLHDCRGDAWYLQAGHPHRVPVRRRLSTKATPLPSTAEGLHG